MNHPMLASRLSLNLKLSLRIRLSVGICPPYFSELECDRGTFICDYSYAGYSLQVKQQIGEMAINGSGIRDTARVLGISPTTVIENLKKKFQVASSE
jgi:InsA C-terminal domain